MEYNKLVRDKIPEIIINSGERSITHIADEKEYEEALKKKLQEEVEEFFKNPTAEELADILEVIYAFCQLMGVDKEQLEQMRKEKAAKRGGFEKRIILERTE